MAFSSTTKYNYIDVVNKFVPEFYRSVDYYQFGSEEDISLDFAGRIIKAAVQNDLFFDVSTLDKSSVALFFDPANKKTIISPNTFAGKILAPYGLTFESFSSISDLYTFVSATFLPDAELNNPSGFFAIMSGISGGKSSAPDTPTYPYSSLLLTHEYLIETLGMFYFMNTSALSSTQASAYASSLLTEALVGGLNSGQVATDGDAIGLLFKYFWHNREESTFYKGFIPTAFASGSASISANTYASGTQLLNSVLLHLNTWTDARLKNHEFLTGSLETVIGDWVNTASMGPYPSVMRDAGSFQRFLKAISLGVADINLILEEISDLLSIDECPERFLELLANNIGWRYLTGDYDKWRAQLANAVMVYKTKGSIVGLDAVLKLVFPDGLFSINDISETWECYLPNLLYYLIKTESYIAKDGLEFQPLFSSTFKDVAPGIKFNQVGPTYADAKDRNYRFLVDAILQYVHNKYKVIKLRGRDFRQLPMWTCLSGTGFYHRNHPNDPKAITTASLSAVGVPSMKPLTVMVPPWEKYGFYRESFLTDKEVDEICKILSGTRESFGFEINASYVGSFKTLVNTAIKSVFSLTGSPTWSVNDKFLFFTSAHELPPNYAKYVKFGNTDEVADFDLWNTKSSHVFSVLAASSFDYTVDGYDTFRNKAALEVYRDVLREFIPLHVVARIVLYLDLEDTHCAISNLCVIAEECIDDYNTGYLNSKRANFWAGASGTGDLSPIYVNGDGRVLPVYVSSVTSLFWNASASDLDRNTSRRRDYRYALPCYPLGREGTAMPVALNHFRIVPGCDATAVTANGYLNTSEYIIKGFDYARQRYLDMSSSVWGLSGFWISGNDCAVSGDSGEFDLSNTYPMRVVPDDVQDCSSVPRRRGDLKTIMKVMTRAKIREAPDSSSLLFSDADYKKYSFGKSVHQGYDIYNDEFSGVLKNTVSPGVPFYGGHNFISYAFGPTFWNSDFRYKGKITQNALAPGDILPGQTSPNYGYLAEWRYIVGAQNAGGQKYLNYGGSAITLNSKTYFSDAPDASSLSALSGVISTVDEANKSIKKTNEILSGLEIRQLDSGSKAFIVANEKSGFSEYNSITAYSLGIYGEGLEVAIPFKPSLIGEITYNKLRPQSKFRADFILRTATNTFDQELEVELFITPSSSDAMTWAYDWYDNRWRVYDDSKASLFKNKLCADAGLECPNVCSVDFNTLEDSTDKYVPCSGAIFEGDVHTSATEYVLKVKGATPSRVSGGIVEDGINLYEISIVDTGLNNMMRHFTSPEIYEIYKFWDGLVSGSLSRNATYSAPYFETLGGSRAEYVELLGGATYSSSSIIDSVTVMEFSVSN